MKATRTYGDLEFMIRWNERSSEPLPTPLLYVSRSRTNGEHNRLRRELREKIRAKPDFAADQLVEVIAKADIRVEIRSSDTRDPDGPGGVLRLLGVRLGPLGYTIKQLPSALPRISDGFAVTECDAVGLATELVAQLPAAPVGRLGDVVLPAAGPAGKAQDDYSYRRSPVFESADEGVPHRGGQFYAAPTTRTGSISIVQGTSRFGPRGITQRALRWRDLEDDGRYVITAARPPVAAAADAKRMVGLINQQIAEVVRAIKDDRR